MHRQPSMLQLVRYVALLLFVCLVTVPAPANAARAIYNLTYPNATTSQYRSNSGASYYAYVDGSNAITGTLAHRLAWFGQHFPITNYSKAGIPFFSAELMLPNESDDVAACASAVLQSQNEFNESYAGKIMLVRRGSCGFSVKAQRAIAAGAAAVVIYGCSTAAPTNCDPGLVSMTGAQVVRTAATYIQSADGFIIANYLASRRAQRKALAAAVAAGNATGNFSVDPPVVLSFVSTGPIDPAERQSLIDLMKQSVVLGAIEDGGYGGTRNLTLDEVSNSLFDPCLQRVEGLLCENGHVLEIMLTEMQWTSKLPGNTLPPALGKFPQLTHLTLDFNNFEGAVPPEICQLTSLQSLVLDTQNTIDGFTSLPSCMNTWTNIRTFTFSGNSISVLPDFSNATRLTYLDATQNFISVLPSTFSNWTQLQFFSFESNQIQVLPSFSRFTQVVEIHMAKNQLSATLTPTIFDGLTSLTVLSLEGNNLRGVLPYMKNCPSLTTLTINDNAISSSIPPDWRANIPNLQTLHASNNLLYSPANTLTTLLYLQDIDLRYNKFNATGLDPTQDYNVGAFLSSVASPSTVHLLLDHNEIAGFWENGWLVLSPNLQELSLSYNYITSLPTTLFTVPFTSLDVSYNSITRWVATQAPSSTVLFLSLLHNPALSVDVVPDWIVASQQMVNNPGEDFLCPSLGSTSSRLMKLLVDSSFTKYKGCTCAKGTFGFPPLCQAVPLTAVLTASGDFYSSEIGSDFTKMVALTNGRVPVVVPNGTNPATVDLSDRSFGDSWYGNSRLTLGISTSWVIDLTPNSNATSIIAASALSSGLNSTSSGSVTSTANSDTRPVYYIRIRFYISRSRFSSETDVLTVYEGSNAAGTRVAFLRGTDPLPDVDYKIDALSGNITLINGNELSTDDVLPLPDTYLGGAYSSELRDMNDTAVWDVVVFGQQATVSFTSRDESGTHFAAFYTYNRDRCPTGYFFDVNIGSCRVNLIPWEVSSGLRSAVWATGGFALFWVLLNTFAILTCWHSSIVRAASRPFLLLTLFFLGLMALGSLLYAAIPTDDSNGRFVCQARGWLAAWPLTGILAVLLAKSNRLTQIFGSNKLQVKKVTDTDLLISVLVMLSVVSVFLGVYSGMPLTAPLVAEGSGTLAGRLVASCHNSDDFQTWIGVLLAFVFCLMLCAMYLAFRTRDLPSRFNESSHIWNAILLLLFYGCLLVPLVFYIQDTPNAAMLLQGVGQSLLCCLLTNVIFTPKLWLLATRKIATDGGSQLTHVNNGPSTLDISTAPPATPNMTAEKGFTNNNSNRVKLQLNSGRATGRGSIVMSGSDSSPAAANKNTLSTTPSTTNSHKLSPKAEYALKHLPYSTQRDPVPSTSAEASQATNAVSTANDQISRPASASPTTPMRPLSPSSIRFHLHPTSHPALQDLVIRHAAAANGTADSPEPSPILNNPSVPPVAPSQSVSPFDQETRSMLVTMLALMRDGHAAEASADRVALLQRLIDANGTSRQSS